VRGKRIRGENGSDDSTMEINDGEAQSGLEERQRHQGSLSTTLWRCPDLTKNCAAAVLNIVIILYVSYSQLCRAAFEHVQMHIWSRVPAPRGCKWSTTGGRG
jgi:hypothetical protein